ncbi:MAG: hypothetical protein QOD42_679 [Sphingomonadales bacterium]|jgi:ATP-dependent protease ClpP protease subunit|nr:hypothetical protein [Sphingomonadales bacterium]
MARDETARHAPEILARPQISLVGDIDKYSVERFLDQLGEAEKAGDNVVLELTTEGGDPEMARRIVFEIESARRRLRGRFLFLGKAVVYSAGITIMSAFPCTDRWLARETMLMIHGRKLDKTVEISGPMRASVPMIDALRAQMETALALEEKGFRKLIEGCDIGLDELMEKALHNWYLTAEEAAGRGLVAGIFEG